MDKTIADAESPEATGYVEVVFKLPTEKSFTYATLPGEFCEVGCRVEAPFRKRKKIGYVISASSRKPPGDFTIQSILRTIDKEPLLSSELLELARWIASYYFCSLGEVISVMIPGAKRESALAVGSEAEVPAVDRLELSEEQNAAVQDILSEPHGIYYLRGITGSGKTEVFLRVAEETLAMGRGVLYLVPEIALTHQLVEHLIARFGNIVGVIHSKLTKSQRLSEWQRIARGEATFVVGARSAVFSPMPDLGLCIIDEEHEGSYKSNATPRYSARQVGMKRASISGARLVMGSATPSIEAMHQIRTGAFRNLQLTQRLSGGALPTTTIVDMKRENDPLSKVLREKILTAHAEGRQSILFLNRRGFSYFFHCKSCGYEMTCRQCSVTLTYHKRRDRMLCHYCGFSQEPIEVCPECGSLDVGYAGFGTEMIEETVASTFPNLSVKRVDTDTVKKRGTLEKVIQEFGRGEIDLLLGTQMVAKGLNFPGVKLVGIVNADTGLNLPDFRSEERVFSLIVQVSGRAGRFAPDGEVIIQTYRPENPAIALAAADEIEAFYDRELAVRSELGFPPFSRLIRIVFRGKSADVVRSVANQWGDVLSATADSSTSVFGPTECALSIISGNYRMHVLVRSASMADAHGLVYNAVQRSKRNSGVYVEIDVDPVALL
jgi:primosomal protein N' (replication factor Y) (superfamily II helicase)